MLDTSENISEIWEVFKLGRSCENEEV